MDYCKLAGAALILAGSLWAGVYGAQRLRRTHENLRDLIAAMELMAGEIAFAGTPFVPLCRRAAEGRGKAVQSFFRVLGQEGERSDFVAAGLTSRACLEAGLVLPGPAFTALERLFDGFGRFDREGQLQQLRLTAGELASLSGALSEQMEGKCRTYQVLGLSGGAALLILVL